MNHKTNHKASPPIRQALAGVVLAAITLSASSIARATDITVVSWGGAYSAAQNQAYLQPYMAQHPDINIINDDSAAEAIARMRAMHEAGNVTWDLVDVTADDALRACDEGLAIEIDIDRDLAPAPDGTPPSEDFGDLAGSPCHVPTTLYSTAFAYRIDKVGDTPPSNICDIFDLETYPGKRALEKRPISNVEWALLCDGVAKEDIYTLLESASGVERALAKLDTIKDETIWWSAGAETPQLLADGEVVIGSGYNGRLFSVIEEQHQPIAMMWDAQVFDVAGWMIPAGLPPERERAARKLLYFATTAQRLADITQYISYPPARQSSTPLIGKHATLGIDMAPHMPNHPDNAKTIFYYNHEFWADNRDDIDARFHAWLAR